MQENSQVTMTLIARLSENEAYSHGRKVSSLRSASCLVFSSIASVTNAVARGILDGVRHSAMCMQKAGPTLTRHPHKYGEDRDRNILAPYDVQAIDLVNEGRRSSVRAMLTRSTINTYQNSIADGYLEYIVDRLHDVNPVRDLVESLRSAT